MYLRANNRYPRRRRISLWRILLWLIAPLVIFIGIGIYQNRDTYIPMVSRALSTAVGQAEGAVATMQAPTPTPTPDPAIGKSRAEDAWNQGNYQEAVQRYGEVIGALPNDWPSHFTYTLGLITEGRDQEAVEAAANAVTANPYSWDAWAIQAFALTLADRYNEAVASSLRALELNEESARAHAFFGLALLELNQIERANAEINRAIELDPDGWEGYYARAQIAFRSTFDFEALREDLNIAYDNSGGLTFIGVDLALEDISREGGDPARGEERLREMDERNPNNPLILAQLGNYYWRGVGDPQQAQQFLDRCVSTVPTASSCQYLLGRIQRDNELPEQAAASFKLAVDSGSQNPQHYYWAALSQEELNNCPVAREYWTGGYELALQTSSWIPDFEEAMRTSVCGPFDVPTPTPDVTLEVDPALETTAEPGV
jgi:tetratricopeptide (TPR) repeat protein